MGKFFRNIGNKFKQFGRTLQRGSAKFGRMLSDGAEKVSGGLGSAQKFVSKLEKGIAGVPVIGSVASTGLNLLNKGLGVGKGISNIADAGGHLLTAASTGNVGGIVNASKDAVNAIKDTGALGTEFIGSAAPLLL